MVFKILVSSALLILYASNVLADASYDSEKNVVELKTPLLQKNMSNGVITIYNKKHIEIFGSGLDESKTKLVELCGVEPSLGLIFLNGKLSLDAKVPKVTEVNKYPESEDNKEGNAAGWVHHYVLKENDAEDLLDLLYENKVVGFAIQPKGCTETKHHSLGFVKLEFRTNGLERAMSRIK